METALLAEEASIMKAGQIGEDEAGAALRVAPARENRRAAPLLSLVDGIETREG
jgi:hypothetical protein